MKNVDLTLLKPEASEEDILNLVNLAKKHENIVAGVCVNPYFVKKVSEQLKETSIQTVTVVGFPLGMNTLDTKAQETKDAIKNGVTEIDMVINHNHILEKNYHLIEQEVKKLKNICSRHDVLLKVIVETSRLNTDQKEMVCKFVLAGGADYIKTSTGFTNGGATVEDVKLFKSLCKKMKIKASGGIRTKEQFNELVEAGASRIGTSSISYLIDGTDSTSSY